MPEIKTSIVKAVTFKKEGTGKRGTWYLFNISFENGDEGSYFADKNPQTYFTQGAEAKYEYEVTQNGNYTNKTIKDIRERGGKFGGNPKLSAKIAALDAAVKIVVAGKNENIKTLELADKFNEWLNK